MVIFTVKASKGKKLVIMCLLNKKVGGVVFARKMKKLIDTMGVENGIIISNSRYTSACKREARKYNIELIPRHFPLFNLFKHKLVPKHEILSPEKADILLERFHIKPHQLPLIRASDVALVAIGAKVGDIIMITRKSPTAGKYVAYRYVVPG
jgi:DNA-directed RNA polymerase subunit H